MTRSGQNKKNLMACLDKTRLIVVAIPQPLPPQLQPKQGLMILLAPLKMFYTGNILVVIFMNNQQGGKGQ